MLRFEPSRHNRSLLLWREPDGTFREKYLGHLNTVGMFQTDSTVAYFTADELRTIADELDRLNRAGEGK